jgi:hypothetical protein
MKREELVLIVALGAAAGGCDASTAGPDDVSATRSALTLAPVDLIAIGAVSGNLGDLATQTAGPLENGVAGNLLGGLGSGLAYAGGDTFLAVPDRGPNAVSYDAAIDDTTSFIARFQTFCLHLEPSAPGSALPFDLAPALTDTTLLSERQQPLVYGTGAGLGVGSGAPALNRKNLDYFTGRSDNFDPAAPSTNPSDARLDPESVRVSNNGKRVYVSDEYGPFVYQFNRETGRRKRTFALPPAFAITNLSPQGAVEIAGNTSGRVTNKGMEGLAITPDSKTLFGAMQSPLLQDGGTGGRFIRVVAIRVHTGAVQQYAYELTNIGTAAKPKYPTVSDIVAVNDHELLVDERDGKGRGDDSTAAYKKIYRIDLTGAIEVSAISGDANLAGTAVPKTLFLDVVATLNAHGIGSNDIPAKLEGLAFGPDLVVGGVAKHTLFLTNDNDFIATVVDSNHPAGVDNPNQFFVFAVDRAALPTYVPQALGGLDPEADPND